MYQNQLFVLNSKPVVRLAYRARLPRDLQKWLIFGVIHAVVEGNFLFFCEIKYVKLINIMQNFKDFTLSRPGEVAAGYELFSNGNKFAVMGKS